MRTIFIVMGLICITFGPSFAQTKTKPPEPVSSEPETTTASYGAWILRCTHRQQGQTKLRICDIEESVAVQGQQAPIAQIGIGHFASKDEMQITAIVPTNITFQVAPRVTSQDSDPGVQLAWRRCLPGGCIADAILPEDRLRAWHAVAADTGRLSFTNAAGRPVAIEFSFHGFAQAMDALVKERS